MNREIKFRFWDTTDMRFINLCRIDENGKVRDGNDYYDDVVVQQYTGLKDKNGKEIYEGDILGYSGSLMYEMLWNDLMMCFVASTITNQDGMYFLTTGDIKESNIIGNIFETPHLLQHV